LRSRLKGFKGLILGRTLAPPRLRRIQKMNPHAVKGRRAKQHTAATIPNTSPPMTPLLVPSPSLPVPGVTIREVTSCAGWVGGGGEGGGEGGGGEGAATISAVTTGVLTLKSDAPPNRVSLLRVLLKALLLIALLISAAVGVVLLSPLLAAGVLMETARVLAEV